MIALAGQDAQAENSAKDYGSALLAKVRMRRRVQAAAFAARLAASQAD